MALVRANPEVVDGVLLGAAASGDCRAARIALFLGADADAASRIGSSESRVTPLHCTAFGGHVDVARLLIARGADVGREDAKGWTPLHWAVSGGPQDADEMGAFPGMCGAPAMDAYVALARLLIEHGADVNAKDRQGGTPLHRAASGGQVSLIDVLIEKGARVNATTAVGGTPLHSAARAGRLDAVRRLLAKGADVNARSARQRTPLHWAVEAGKREVARLLLTQGADVNAKDREGMTPADLAFGEEMKRMLGECGAVFVGGKKP